MKKQIKNILGLLLTLCFAYTNAQERILNFDTKIKVEQSGIIKVLENITIKAERVQFLHGLLRTLPLTRKDNYGNNINVGYTIDYIKKDGIEEKYFTKESDGNWKIYIGNKDIDLATGVYVYQIAYSVPYQIGYFDDYDEIYWNVTGNEWQIPINKVSCELLLPKDSDTFLNIHSYTGYKGAKASEGSEKLNDHKTRAYFYANNLKSNQGLTVAASFPKGVVSPASALQKTASIYSKIKGTLWLTLFAIGMFIFYFLQWQKNGKDPKKKTIIAQFRPPFNWSPAIVGYVYNKGVNDKIYMASMVNTAIKGAIKLTSTVEKSLFTTKKLYEIVVLNTEVPHLSEEEKALFKPIAKKKKLLVSRTYYDVFAKAYTGWITSVTNQININSYYTSNTRKKNIGFLVLVNMGLFFVLLSNSSGYINYGFFIMLIGSSATTYWLSKKIEKIGMQILRAVLCFFVVIPTIFTYFASLFFKSWIEIAVQGFIFIAYIIYCINLGKYTIKGSEAIEKLEGFKLYLETAEKNKMNMLNPPELTPELFEELLPYAIALNVDVVWGKQFETLLETAKYNPEWYSGDDSYKTPERFISNLGDAVGASRVDPTPSRSSSSDGSSGSWNSGSSGGGSSGGGGGGGGGGGW
ncbi:DUF2207 domain-containing protein [Flavobacterium psychrophilum]|uniref:DUF2207 domain-containing protein n=2 Tax=Flavobacterium psychrophilum TaxID=96345 RepID=UPI0004F74C4A|nr:DUF2207 domain-containing protein [Flavobacterium psychrophilum]AIN75206.1 hypothetical protein FPG3_09535 [Flavobacterium psychrophilum FPG3]EKT2068346.1 DUF2207 domain-containing protein [Flavobacterium psychrophilum]EKT2071424.1 DUF2207 domain-containing protein [Flavobacterium psychrophilum]EKT4490945.1 DUF2207 domain-containing protein [Flavobacterium psychrophilum]MBF2045466.1 DUF2207 domain-containing protein [Flavobacterium psychrophilum]